MLQENQKGVSYAQHWNHYQKTDFQAQSKHK